MIRTTSAWLDKKEVVEVVFDPAVTRFATLLAAARCVKNPSTVYVQRKQDLAAAREVVGDDAVLTDRAVRPAKASDQHYYLRRSPFWPLPMTSAQAARLNGIAGEKQPAAQAASVLSPGQLRLLREVRKGRKDKAKALRLRALPPVRGAAGFRAREAELRRILRG